LNLKSLYLFVANTISTEHLHVAYAMIIFCEHLSVLYLLPALKSVEGFNSLDLIA